MAVGNVEFAILGAGAIGSIIGAHLARSGHTVVMLARGQRAQGIELRGLRIKGLVEISQRVPVLTNASEFSGADVLIVATKTYGTEAALAPLIHARIGTAFSIQNGLMKNDQLSAAWGRERVLGALANTSGELLPDGEVLFTRNEQLCIGELDGGVSARAARIALTAERAARGPGVARKRPGHLPPVNIANASALRLHLLIGRNPRQGAKCQRSDQDDKPAQHREPLR